MVGDINKKERNQILKNNKQKYHKCKCVTRIHCGWNNSQWSQFGCHTGFDTALWGCCHHSQWGKCPNLPLTCVLQEIAPILHSMEKIIWKPQIVGRYKKVLLNLHSCKNYEKIRVAKELYFSFLNWTQCWRGCLASPINHCLGFKLGKLCKQMFTSYSLTSQIKFELNLSFLTSFSSGLINRSY